MVIARIFGGAKIVNGATRTMTSVTIELPRTSILRRRASARLGVVEVEVLVAVVATESQSKMKPYLG
jgi:hypothetical protein